jgi:bifunctional DNA-binding transcriptional regulator/antitoxin component of YhaV-PrlF toxin-antitoxin module
MNDTIPVENYPPGGAVVTKTLSNLTNLYSSDRLIIRKSANQESSMTDTITLQMSQRGIFVLPKSLRETYNLQPGDTFTLLDLGGSFVITPRRSEIDSLADRISRALAEKGETLESMLQAVREERERYGTNTQDLS